VSACPTWVSCAVRRASRLRQRSRRSGPGCRSPRTNDAHRVAFGLHRQRWGARRQPLWSLGARTERGGRWQVVLRPPARTPWSSTVHRPRGARRGHRGGRGPARWRPSVFGPLHPGHHRLVASATRSRAGDLRLDRSSRHRSSNSDARGPAPLRNSPEEVAPPGLKSCRRSPPSGSFSWAPCRSRSSRRGTVGFDHHAEPDRISQNEVSRRAPEQRGGAVSGREERSGRRRPLRGTGSGVNVYPNRVSCGGRGAGRLRRPSRQGGPGCRSPRTNDARRVAFDPHRPCWGARRQAWWSPRARTGRKMGVVLRPPAQLLWSGRCGQALPIAPARRCAAIGVALVRLGGGPAGLAHPPQSPPPGRLADRARAGGRPLDRSSRSGPRSRAQASSGSAAAFSGGRCSSPAEELSACAHVGGVSTAP
jgi:hypothetical protein